MRLVTRLTLLLALLAALLVAIDLLVAERAMTSYAEEVTQSLDRNLARQILDAKRVMFIDDDGELAVGELDPVFHWMMVVNPRAEFYLADRDGKLLAWHAEPGQVERESIDLGPVKAFLDGAPLPIRGDDPRGAGRKIFSAARLQDSTGIDRGYLYIVLESQLHDSAAALVGGSHIARRAAATFLMAALLVVGAGLWAMRRWTMPLSDLDRRVHELDPFGTGKPLIEDEPAEADLDEVGRLARSFAVLEERLAEQVAGREASERDRRQLISNVSHDLRTPIATLRGYLETLQLKGDAISAERRDHYLQIALGQSERLSKLVDELFELSKLDAGDFALDREPLPIAELLHDHAHRFTPAAAEREVAIRCDIEQDPVLVQADVARLERVLENLVGNAIRFSRAGTEVRLGMAVEPSEVVISVQDEGPGIADTEQDRVFDRLYQASNGGFPGTGLGLAISRRIVDAHGGRIWVESREGLGTTFRFSLPR